MIFPPDCRFEREGRRINQCINETYIFYNFHIALIQFIFRIFNPSFQHKQYHTRSEMQNIEKLGKFQVIQNE